jgi:hypothetical protein
MKKYTDDLSTELVEKVEKIAMELGFTNAMMTIKPICMNKSKKEVISIIKPNDLTKMVLKDESLVVVAVFEQAFNLVDESVQNNWIRNCLSQIVYDFDKDTISIKPHPISMSYALYQKEGSELVKDLQLANEILAEVNVKK